MKRCMVLGAGGFIGGHLCRRLHAQGNDVRGVDIREAHDWYQQHGTSFYSRDLANRLVCDDVLHDAAAFAEIYACAADMGGAGFIFSGDHDATLMTNSARINLNVADALVRYGFRGTLFFSSSACVYNASLQTDPANPGLKESDAYPANCDSKYAWEKLFSEQLYEAYARNHGLEIRIARFHNIMGIASTYDGGREKAPAAICRKVAQAPDGGEIEIWGDGLQTRSFLDVDDCLDGVQALMNGSYKEPINIGSEEIISINDLAYMVMDIAGKKLTIKHIPGPLGVRGRTSDNTLCREKLNWQPKLTLRQGLEKLYPWIERQLSLQGK